MSKLFISHSSQDDAFVRDLRAALADHGQDGWVDSRELRGGDPLWPEIKKAIEAASAYVVVISAASFQSDWVSDELEHAIKVQKKRGKEAFPVIPLMLDGAKRGAFKKHFGEEPLHIPVTSGAGGVELAMNAILVALGKRLNADASSAPQPRAEPVEELVLELTDLKFQEQDGKRRATARARLVYQPGTAGQREVASKQTWRLVAPLGPIETEELRWYLEKYAIWPSHYFHDRARKVEKNLEQWGQLLHTAAMPVAHTANAMQAWATIASHAGRRFSVHVDAALEAGMPEADVKLAQEVATELLKAPWELLHDGDSFLFQGAKPVRVRRRLPNTKVLDLPIVATPIRILLVTARPDDDSCGYIDHRASALPLVEAMEALPGLVQIHVLSPPTLPALREELDRARDEKQPYHVVHFDGHGVYDKQVGLGGLCFEHPDDAGQSGQPVKLENRRHVTIYTRDSTEHGTGLESLLCEHRIPLVFLEACQTAQAEKASESVASELLKVGVASVVAMSHSVLVETARRFVEAFYQALAAGKRVGDAMLAGQRKLKDDTGRGRIFGAGELRLEDWFVPVLFQEKDDPQLFRGTLPSRQTVEDAQARLVTRLGDVPAEPATGFVGRSRELLALERLLHCGSPLRGEGHVAERRATQRYAVIRGQGGEGKTALAAEFAQWMVRSQQIRRAAFVSVETHGHVAAVLDVVGRQLVGQDYSVAAFDDREKAILPIERALREQPTLLVVDNMESILLPPFLETPEALSEEAGRELQAILGLCERLLKVGETRIVFTSREALPAPFDAERHRRELHRLDREDAVKLVERVLNAEDLCATASAAFNSTGSLSGTGRASGTQDRDHAAMDARREEIEQLVDAVHCHARTLALLAPALQRDGVEKTRLDFVNLMDEMDRRYPVGTPESREKSVFASVELSLRRMSPANRDRARVLGVFHGGVNMDVLRMMMQWEEADVGALAGELIETGLSTPNRYNHLTLDPALCPYLRGQMESTVREALTARWVEAMRAYAEFLRQQQSQNTEVAATLTGLELRNLFALLDLVQRAGDAEATIGLATSLCGLLKNVGKPRLLERVGQVRDAAAGELERTLGDAWNHARFEAAQSRIEQQLAGGRLRQAFEGAQQLLLRAQAAGEQAYPGADYDLAMAGWLLARVWKTAGGSEQALPLLDEARQRFEAIVAVSLRETEHRVRSERATLPAEQMAAKCFAELGDCLRNLGRLDEAAAAYEERIRRGEQLGDARGVSVGKSQLGTVRMQQCRYPEALAAYAEARERFTQLDEPGTVAVFWHQNGMVYQEAGSPEAAEDAYWKSLAIDVRLGNVAGQASTLGQLGSLYKTTLGRTEESVPFFQQAADKFSDIPDEANEAKARSGLATALGHLRRFDEARQEIRRSIVAAGSFGNALAPWKFWAILANIETDANDPAAAAEAKSKAIACYLAYRRDGGENHDAPGRIALAVTQSLRDADPAQAATLLRQQLPSFEAAGFGGFIRALQAIVAGRRDRTLADAAELDFSMAAEILFLIETLEAAGNG